VESESWFQRILNKALEMQTNFKNQANLKNLANLAAGSETGPPIALKNLIQEYKADEEVEFKK